MDAGEELVVACSFCGKTQRQARKLIAGPNVYICDECVGLCNAIIEEELGEDPAGDAREAVLLPYGEAAKLYELLHNAFKNDNAFNLTSVDVAVVNRLHQAIESAGRGHSQASD